MKDKKEGGFKEEIKKDISEEKRGDGAGGDCKNLRNIIRSDRVRKEKGGSFVRHGGL